MKTTSQNRVSSVSKQASKLCQLFPQNKVIITSYGNQDKETMRQRQSDRQAHRHTDRQTDTQMGKMKRTNACMHARMHPSKTCHKKSLKELSLEFHSTKLLPRIISHQLKRSSCSSSSSSTRRRRRSEWLRNSPSLLAGCISTTLHLT